MSGVLRSCKRGWPLRSGSSVTDPQAFRRQFVDRQQRFSRLRSGVLTDIHLLGTFTRINRKAAAAGGVCIEKLPGVARDGHDEIRKIFRGERSAVSFGLGDLPNTLQIFHVLV